jgi:hypothetical protein
MGGLKFDGTWSVWLHNLAVATASNLTTAVNYNGQGGIWATSVDIVNSGAAAAMNCGSQMFAAGAHRAL